MRVIVCGSRRWHDRASISNRLGELVLEHAPDYPVIVHGGARGADRIAHQEAQKHGLPIEEHWPNYQRYGKRAPLVRNEQMAALGADLCIAFLKDNSTGTLHMIGEARRCGIPVEVMGPAA